MPGFNEVACWGPAAVVAPRDLTEPSRLSRRGRAEEISARRSPPRKVTYFEPVPPRLARNTIIESTFDVGRPLAALTVGARLAVADA
jgi:hypothetical protein